MLPATCKKSHRFDLLVSAPMANRRATKSTTQMTTLEPTATMLLLSPSTVVKQISDSLCNQLVNCLPIDSCCSQHHQPHHNTWVTIAKFCEKF